MKRPIISLLLAIVSWTAVAQSKHSPTTQYPTYDGLAMAGYQGWFRPPRDGSLMYPDPKNIRIDMWPDVSEYEKTYPTGLKLADGSTARFFSSADASTIDLHFRWMRDYGVDGVFMQRFFNSTRPGPGRERGAQILRHASEAASKNGRALAVMYDLSGLRASGDDCLPLIDDWKFLVDSLKLTDPDGTNTYLYQHGKPVVAIWGVGFPDRPYNIRNIRLAEVIDFFHNDPQYGGCAVMLGVPTFWRDLNADCVKDPYLHELITRADIIMPWMVQRFTPLLHNDMDRYRDVIKADLKWCQRNHVDYVPCVCPGFSWHNLSRFEFPDDVKPPGSIPRQGGRFYWQQISTAIGAGANKLYIAMFDEVNEGTAIFKCTDNPPVSPDCTFMSAGPPDAVGIYVVDDFVLSRICPTNSLPQVLVRTPFGRAAESDSASSSLQDWMQDGIQPTMAKIVMIGQAPQTKALAILDDDPLGHAEWRNLVDRAPPVVPGDTLVAEWNEMHSVAVANTRSAGYEKLPPGNYRFRVREETALGVPTGAEAALAIRVVPPLWERTWFWTSVGTVLVVSSVAGARYRASYKLRRAVQRLQHQRELEQERLRIARDIHDDLGARVTEISMLSAMAPDQASFPQNARADFDRISRLSRDLISALYQTVWAVSPENDNLYALGNYLRQMTSQLCEVAQLRCRFQIPALPRDGQVSSQTRHNITMAVKEAVHNVIKHANASEVTIRVAFDDGWLTVRIQDDGRGFPAEGRPGGSGLGCETKK